MCSDIVPDRRLGEVAGISVASAWIDGQRRRTSIRGAQDIATENKEVSRVKGFPRAYERAPPVAHVTAPRQGVAYDESIVALLVQFSPCLVCDWAVKEFFS